MPETSLVELTPEEIENPQGTLERLRREKEQILELQAQVQRDGENLYVQAKEKCKKDLAEIGRRESILQPQEDALRVQKGEVSSLLANITARETLAAQRDKTITARSQAVDERDRSLSAERVLLTQDMTAHKSKVLAEEAKLKGDRMIFEQHKAAVETKMVEEGIALDTRAQNISRDEAGIAERRAKVEETAREIEAIRDKLSVELGTKAVELEQREGAVSVNSEAAAKQMAAAQEKEKQNEAERIRLDTQKEEQEATVRGLERAKLDLEVAQAKFRKREVLVNALIEKHGLSEELSRLEDPVVGQPAGN